MEVHEIELAVHTEQGRRVIVQIPLQEGEKGSRYSASPDGKQFVLQTGGANPMLLIVPVRNKVKAKEIKRIAI
jgi:hypothetical protein